MIPWNAPVAMKLALLASVCGTPRLGLEKSQERSTRTPFQSSRMKSRPR